MFRAVVNHEDSLHALFFSLLRERHTWTHPSGSHEQMYPHWGNLGRRIAHGGTWPGLLFLESIAFYNRYATSTRKAGACLKFWNDWQVLSLLSALSLSHLVTLQQVTRLEKGGKNVSGISLFQELLTAEIHTFQRRIFYGKSRARARTKSNAK